MSVPADRRYTKSHEWAKLEGDGTVTVGLTDHAQCALGDIVFLELPEQGAVVRAGDDVAVVESVKAASDIYAPITGEIIDVNVVLVDQPDLVNQDAYGSWLFRLHPANVNELDALLSAADYAELA